MVHVRAAMLMLLMVVPYSGRVGRIQFPALAPDTAARSAPLCQATPTLIAHRQAQAQGTHCSAHIRAPRPQHNQRAQQQKPRAEQEHGYG